MVGRGWVANPWAFAMADDVLYPNENDDWNEARPKNRLEVLEAYGRHADYEEQLWDAVKIRRFLTKAVSHLFAGEPNAKRYRIALDEIAGLPKKFAKEQQRRQSNPLETVQQTLQLPSLSELILDAATTHLSEEVLYRSPKESYEKLLWEEEEAKRKQTVVSTIVFGGNSSGGPGNANTGNENGDGNARKSAVQEWQQSRKEEERREMEERRVSVNEVD